MPLRPFLNGAVFEPEAIRNMFHAFVQAANFLAIVSLLVDFEMGSKKKFRWKPLNREADGVRSVRKTSVPNWLAPRFPITGGGTAPPRSTATTINIVAAISEAQQSSAPYPAKAAEASAPHLRAQSRGVTVDHDSPDKISPGYRGRLVVEARLNFL